MGYCFMSGKKNNNGDWVFLKCEGGLNICAQETKPYPPGGGPYLFSGTGDELMVRNDQCLEYTDNYSDAVKLINDWVKTQEE